MKSSQFILRLLRWVNSLLWVAKNVYNGYKRVLSQTCQSTLAKWNVHWILTVNNFTSYLRKTGSCCNQIIKSTHSTRLFWNYVTLNSRRQPSRAGVDMLTQLGRSFFLILTDKKKTYADIREPGNIQYSRVLFIQQCLF